MSESNPSNESGKSSQFDINKVIADAKTVITNPAGYYRDMPRTGGYVEPLIFIAVMAVAMGVISAVLSLVGGMGAMMVGGLAAVIIMPIWAIIGAFIGAAILFVIWKLMGSEQSYETAFRCLAAATAVYPIMAVLSIIPYLGAVIGVVWMSYLMIEASVGVHGRNRKTATIVFGIIGALLVISNLGSEYAARNMADRADEYSRMMQEYEQMSPDEAGRKMGEFLKGFEDAVGDKTSE